MLRKQTQNIVSDLFAGPAAAYFRTGVSVNITESAKYGTDDSSLFSHNLVLCSVCKSIERLSGNKHIHILVELLSPALHEHGTFCYVEVARI